MSKYKTKQQLLNEISRGKTTLTNILNEIDESLISTPGACNNWSIKDILAHISEWQEMVITWYEIGLSNKTPDVPAKDYKWSQLPELNNSIYEKHKNDAWEVVQKRFNSIETKIMELINSIDEKNLLKPALQPWMNQNALIAYFGSCTASHYNWATTLIKKFLKNSNLR